MIAAAAEIAIRKSRLLLWRKELLQLKGGPMGVRTTMCTSRLVVNDWGERYIKILISSNIRLWIRTLFVDDVRQVTGGVKPGVRFCKDKRLFIYKKE